MYLDVCTILYSQFTERCDKIYVLSTYKPLMIISRSTGYTTCELDTFQHFIKYYQEYKKMKSMILCKFINLILNNGNNDASLTNKSTHLVVVMT